MENKGNETNKNIIKKKRQFIWNALEDGWEIRKKDKSYIFSKKHEGKEEVFSESFLRAFIVKNLNNDNIKL
jgi:hypothetical protein|tara:strand:+ start:225 stop:437 length:213 start_codon:yes stop_codon:yes gene_type:complete